MDKEIVDILKSIQSSMTNLDGKVDNLDNRMDKLEGKVDNLDNRMDKLEGKVDNLDNRMDKLEDKVDKLDNTIDTLQDKVVSIKLTQQEHTLLLRSLEHSAEINKSEHEDMKYDINTLIGKVENIEKGLNFVEMATANNWSEIVKLKSIK
ncbi:hypothetical protein CLPU_21c00380 [Gottschalkia purinilytica]|uniref:Uncharacterized protein n=1 Tax=Gottschalkia purinilytica TaxID=1503 RepID=A0A0L0W7E6_GOTPU|nr:DUF2730 family protein [Gottschalkia purinilytica]KNF07220.1 hypothetical protein CLPU_21c00380 [Gottschalkia purinilytica]